MSIQRSWGVESLRGVSWEGFIGEVYSRYGTEHETTQRKHDAPGTYCNGVGAKEGGVVVGAGLTGTANALPHSSGTISQSDRIDILVTVALRTLYWTTVMRWSAPRGKWIGPWRGTSLVGLR